MGSPEITKWVEWYRLHDEARAGRSMGQVLADHADGEE